MARDEELLKLAARSGCRGLILGLETTSQESLREAHKDYPHRPMAELVAELSNAGFAERVKIPSSEKDCASAVTGLRERLDVLEKRFEELAASRTGTDKLLDGIVGTLKRWSLHGRD